MVRYTTLRTAAVLVFCLVLASPLATAAAPRPGGEPFTVRLAAQDAGDLFGWLKGALASLWSKNGCQVDPFGRCLAAVASPASTKKNGCEVDPNGRCGN
ncbi:MAG TPA: hypothetical protein VKK31_01210 [Thermoanaerobaculia bacterium]|nr:hypothetical protein [Thermoanaerobaculia bacterium]